MSEPPASVIVGVQRFPQSVVVEIIERFDSAGIMFWVDGGWGVDALLRKQAREHWDLDLVVRQADLPAAVRELRALGYSHEPDVVPGLPARMVVGNAARQQIDLHPVVLDECGNGWQPLDGEAWDQYPHEGLAGEGEIGGRAVRCLTAALQLRHHLGYPWDEDDQGDMGRLAAAFGVPMPPPQGDVPAFDPDDA